MWILHFLPDSFLALVVHIILLLGIAGILLGFYLKNIIGILRYHIPIKILSILLIIFGVYFEGSYTTEMSWREKVVEVEAKVKEAEAKSQQVNVVIQEKIVEKIKVIKQRVVVNHDVIRTHREVIDAECKIPDIAFKIYNTSIENGVVTHE